jgi:alpha-beta hydrolase superfamily lysophospholipase
MIARREILKAGAALVVIGMASGVPGFALAQTGITTDNLPITVGTRATRLFVTRVDGKKSKGVVLFSTGWSASPDDYSRLQAVLAIEGFVVLAPLHVDSDDYPDKATKFDQRQVFMERIADMRAASAYAARNYPGLPVIAAGHSFGSLISLCEGGALANLAPFRNPMVKAVLAFSSPGKVSGLIGPESYKALNVPTMMITGTADTVDQFVADPKDHLYPIETSPPGGKYALVVAGADHALAHGKAGFDHALPAVRLFVAAYGLGNDKARKRLAAWHATPGDTFTVREV